MLFVLHEQYTGYRPKSVLNLDGCFPSNLIFDHSNKSHLFSISKKKYFALFCPIFGSTNFT